MAGIDVILQQFFRDHVLLMVYIGFAIYMGYLVYPRTKMWIAWRQLHESEQCYAEELRYQRYKLFVPLQRLMSADIFLRNQGVIRIVDIGIMTGINVKYYPNSTHVIAVDSRYNLEYFFKPFVTTFDHVRIKQYVEYNYEDLKKIPDEFADAVVGSFVLCKAKNEATLLKEIYRILAPGGHYYFFEHCIDKEDRSLRRWQTALSITGIWPHLFYGCHLNRDIERSILQGPFPHVKCTIKKFNFAHPFALKYVRSHVIGCAWK